jgi:hypothetical protein
MTAATEAAKEFDIFHHRHFGKPAHVEERRSVAKDAVIAASHSQ